MRTLNTDKIYAELKRLISSACVDIDGAAENALAGAHERETSENARFALDVLCKNIKYARQRQIPACQDTGMAVVFVEIGQEVFLSGDYIEDAVNRAVREAYSENCFRMSVLDPLTRINTGDNTPAVIHTRIVKGDKVRLSFLAKGFGSENMSRLHMLKPSDGREGIIAAVVDTVSRAGSNPCPPVILGVGIGGTADKAMEIAKHALLRSIGSQNPDSHLSALEKELLEKVNALGIGAQGLGGINTALTVHIEKFPTHLAALPVAVNVQCHCQRVRETVI